MPVWVRRFTGISDCEFLGTPFNAFFVPAVPPVEEEGVTPFFEDVLATQVIPGVEGVPSGEEATVEVESATQPENQTAWGTKVFPTDVSLLSGGFRASL